MSSRQRAVREFRRAVDSRLRGGRLSSYLQGASADPRVDAMGDEELDPGAYEADTGGTIEVVGLPKFIVGHAVLGAVPADPETNPVWEV